MSTTCLTTCPAASSFHHQNPYSRIKTATQSYDRVGAVPRLFRYNTLPLVALLFVLVLFKVFTRIGWVRGAAADVDPQTST